MAVAELKKCTWPRKGPFSCDSAPWEGVSANRKAHGAVDTQRRAKTEISPPHGGLFHIEPPSAAFFMPETG